MANSTKGRYNYPNTVSDSCEFKINMLLLITVSYIKLYRRHTFPFMVNIVKLNSLFSHKQLFTTLFFPLVYVFIPMFYILKVFSLC